MTRKISTDAVESVTAKLHAFAEGLEPEERAAVDAMMAKAVEADSDVSGFTFESGIGSVNLGTSDFDLNTTRSGLKSSLLGRFCPDDEGGPWHLILDDDESQLGTPQM